MKPIILVAGFWLGAWAWDDVAAALRADGHDVTALTLPGLESVDTDRSAITIDDHVDAIGAAVTAAGVPVVLAVHSGAGVPGYAVSDRMPDRIAAMVYVDSGPAKGALDPGFTGVEQAVPEQFATGIDGLTDEQLRIFLDRAVPEPGGAVRGAPGLTDKRRLDIPSTIICTSMSSEQIRAAVAQGAPWLAGLAELHDVTYIDLPTNHWPMWSRPKDLAAVLGEIATRAD